MRRPSAGDHCCFRGWTLLPSSIGTPKAIFSQLLSPRAHSLLCAFRVLSFLQACNRTSHPPGPSRRGTHRRDCVGSISTRFPRLLVRFDGPGKHTQLASRGVSCQSSLSLRHSGRITTREPREAAVEPPHPRVRGGDVYNNNSFQMGRLGVFAKTSTGGDPDRPFRNSSSSSSFYYQSGEGWEAWCVGGFKVEEDGAGK